MTELDKLKDLSIQLLTSLENLLKDNINSRADIKGIVGALYEIHQAYERAIAAGKNELAEEIDEDFLTFASDGILGAIDKGILSQNQLLEIEIQYLKRVYENSGKNRIHLIFGSSNSFVLNILLHHSSPGDTSFDMGLWVANHLPVFIDLAPPQQVYLQAIMDNQYLDSIFNNKSRLLEDALKSDLTAILLLRDIRNGYISLINFLGNNTFITMDGNEVSLLKFFFDNNPEVEIKNEILTILSLVMLVNPGALDDSVKDYINGLLELRKLQINQTNSIDAPSPLWTENWTTPNLAYLAGPQL